jgi:hypothetical protein
MPLQDFVPSDRTGRVAIVGDAREVMGLARAVEAHEL